MRYNKYSSEAILLSRKNYSEADRILVVFTKGYGKLVLLAKGIRKPKSRKRGALEIFSRVKFSANKTKTFDLMTEVEIIDSFAKIRSNLKRVALAYYFVEVVNKITKEEEKNELLYNLLCGYLSKLQYASKLKELRFSFLYQLLVLMGYWPLGKRMDNPDKTIEYVLERRINSLKVGISVLH